MVPPALRRWLNGLLASDGARRCCLGERKSHARSDWHSNGAGLRRGVGYRRQEVTSELSLRCDTRGTSIRDFIESAKNRLSPAGNGWWVCRRDDRGNEVGCIKLATGATTRGRALLRRGLTPCQPTNGPPDQLLRPRRYVGMSLRGAGTRPRSGGASLRCGCHGWSWDGELGELRRW